ncbi:hypothetical protein RQP46_003582 [Phenoliferia psychrophenolica]
MNAIFLLAQRIPRTGPSPANDAVGNQIIQGLVSVKDSISAAGNFAPAIEKRNTIYVNIPYYVPPPPHCSDYIICATNLAGCYREIGALGGPLGSVANQFSGIVEARIHAAYNDIYTALGALVDKTNSHLPGFAAHIAELYALDRPRT